SVDRPEYFEGLVVFEPRRTEQCRGGIGENVILPSASQLLLRGLSKPLIRLPQLKQQVPNCRFTQIKLPRRLLPLPRNPINPPRLRINPPLIMAGVVDPLFVHVGDVESAVGANLNIDGAEPGVLRFEGEADVL